MKRYFICFIFETNVHMFMGAVLYISNYYDAFSWYFVLWNTRSPNNEKKKRATQTDSDYIVVSDINMKFVCSFCCDILFHSLSLRMFSLRFRRRQIAVFWIYTFFSVEFCLHSFLRQSNLMALFVDQTKRIFSHIHIQYIDKANARTHKDMPVNCL